VFVVQHKTNNNNNNNSNNDNARLADANFICFRHLAMTNRFPTLINDCAASRKLLFHGKYYYLIKMREVASVKILFLATCRGRIEVNTEKTHTHDIK
jgi:hypothetical protein